MIMVKWPSEGKIRCRVDVVDGLDHVPGAMNRLFDGSDKGKLIVTVSVEPSLKA